MKFSTVLKSADCRRTLILSIFLAMASVMIPAQAHAAAPCCAVTSVDGRTGTVTARINANGQMFTFRLQNPRELNALRVGQAVFVNFRTKQVSLDGRTIAGTILSLSPASPANGISGRGAPNDPPDGRPIAASPAQPSAGACCAVQSIDMRTGSVTARINANGQMFTFRVQSSGELKALRVGQAVFVNFRTKQVSLDGRTAAGTILSMAPASSINAARSQQGSSIAPGSARAPAPPASAATGSAGTQTNNTQRGGSGSIPNPGGRGAAIAAISSNPVIRNPMRLPQLTFGAPQTLEAGRTNPPHFRVNNQIVSLHGIKAIKNATNIPQGARDFLLLHARTLPPDQVDNYVVNVQLAEEWFAAHPEPEAVKKAAAKGDGHTGCNAISIHCAEEAGKHAEDEAERQSARLLQQAQDEWKHVTKEAAHDLNEVEGCFADQRLAPAGSIPIVFNIDPKIPLSFSRSGNSKITNGTMSGNVNGTVTFGLPVSADFRTSMDFFYIPCLPFAIRPRSISGQGTMDVGSTFQASVNATGQFATEFIIPPTGGPRIPLYVVPVVIDGVPVAEMDVSLYVDGRLDVDGKGNFNGSLDLEAQENANFNFSCNGHGCSAGGRTVPVPAKASESAKLDGRIHVKPAIYTALQFDFDVDALSARAGPEPYLLGEIYGCGAASGTQDTSGQTSGQQSYAVTADLDWGVDLLAEALVARKSVGQFKTALIHPQHLGFWDLAQSSALVPTVLASAQPAAGSPVSYQLKMPACYPYTDQLEYQVSWTGGAGSTGSQPAPKGTQSRIGSTLFSGRAGQSNNSSACAMQPGRADCWGDPVKPLQLELVWPQAGAFNLTVSSVRDKHGRVFNPPGTIQENVSVQ